MCEKLVCKGIKESIDLLLLKHNVDVKIFGNPIKDFDFEAMSDNEIKEVKELMFTKIQKYAV